MPDVAIIGGGIIGCSAAALLAERGASVALFEQSRLGAGASGRNSGALQHPFDPLLAGLYRDTVALYRPLPELQLPEAPVGLLLLSRDPRGASLRAEEVATQAPDLDPRVLDEAEVRDGEPILAAGWSAVMLRTGHPIPPQAATEAMARLATSRGARLVEGLAVRPWVVDGHVRGILAQDGSRQPADAVLVAAGPWSGSLVDPSGGWQPIAPTYGVTVQLEMAAGARHILEEGLVHTVNRRVETRDAGAERDIESLFSMVSVGTTHTIGSTFAPHPVEPERLAGLLVERASALVPSLATARIIGARVCARPQSADGRPFLGSVPGVDGLFVCAGHGPWGISTGPGSARLVVDVILGARSTIPQSLAAGRVVA